MRTLGRDDVREMGDGGDDVPLPPPNHHKRAWPELVGWPELNAGLRICYDRPEVTVLFFNLGDTPPPGFHRKRVVVFVDANLRVAKIPVLG